MATTQKLFNSLKCLRQLKSREVKAARSISTAFSANPRVHDVIDPPLPRTIPFPAFQNSHRPDPKHVPSLYSSYTWQHAENSGSSPLKFDASSTFSGPKTASPPHSVAERCTLYRAGLSIHQSSLVHTGTSLEEIQSLAAAHPSPVHTSPILQKTRTGSTHIHSASRALSALNPAPAFQSSRWGRRSFSQRTVQQGRLQVYMQSPNMIADPFQPSPPKLPFLTKWFTRRGWKETRSNVMDYIKTAYSIAQMRRTLRNYTTTAFYRDITDLYAQINRAASRSDLTAMRQLVTDTTFTLGVDKNNPATAFVQLTMILSSKQRYAAYNKSGKLVAGDPEKEIMVEDIWVFERPLSTPEVKWRLCGRIGMK